MNIWFKSIFNPAILSGEKTHTLRDPASKAYARLKPGQRVGLSNGARKPFAHVEILRNGLLPRQQLPAEWVKAADECSDKGPLKQYRLITFRLVGRGDACVARSEPRTGDGAASSTTPGCAPQPRSASVVDSRLESPGSAFSDHDSDLDSEPRTDGGGTAAGDRSPPSSRSTSAVRSRLRPDHGTRRMCPHCRRVVRVTDAGTATPWLRKHFKPGSRIQCDGSFIGVTRLPGPAPPKRKPRDSHPAVRCVA